MRSTCNITVARTPAACLDLQGHQLPLVIISIINITKRKTVRRGSRQLAFECQLAPQECPRWAAAPHAAQAATQTKADPLAGYEQKLKNQSAVITGKRTHETRSAGDGLSRPRAMWQPDPRQSTVQNIEQNPPVMPKASTSPGSHGKHRRGGRPNVQH